MFWHGTDSPPSSGNNTFPGQKSAWIHTHVVCPPPSVDSVPHSLPHNLPSLPLIIQERRPTMRPPTRKQVCAWATEFRSFAEATFSSPLSSLPCPPLLHFWRNVVNRACKVAAHGFREFRLAICDVCVCKLCLERGRHSSVYPMSCS